MDRLFTAKSDDVPEHHLRNAVQSRERAVRRWCSRGMKTRAPGRKTTGGFLDVPEKLEAPFDLLDMCLVLAIHAHLVLNGLIGMNDGAMIASPEM